MNYILHLSAVFEKMDADSRLSPFHISLYMALFRRWNLNFFNNPVSVSRDELMRLSKIGSVNTYTRCLKDLERFGFIKYEPSYNPYRGSLVYLYSFDNGGEQAVRPFKNNENNTHTSEEVKNFDSEINNQKMKEKKISGFGPNVPPSEEHVRIYFGEKGYPAVEAEKFFNHFQSNGWLVGGRSKMKDWKAAARNWFLNAQKFNEHAKNRRNNPAIRNNRNRSRDYSEPL